jgi:superfamily I DNA/RNA helicase/mRNA-degrading endonuclease RelE of RelBE toxin-antitoxin system
MTACTVSVTNTFLNELLNLPKKISNRVEKTVRILKEDPKSVQLEPKKLKQYSNNVYRARIGDHRLFYSFGHGWVKLLSVRRRDERTYTGCLPDASLPQQPPQEAPQSAQPQSPTSQAHAPKEAAPPVKTIAAGEVKTALPRQPTPELLAQWQIPQEYWNEICQVSYSEELLELSIPERFLSRILDNLFPRAIDDIQNQAEYRLQDPEDLNRFFEGELSAFLLRLDAEQEKLLQFGHQGPILVKGGPGTGKSTLAVYRVQRLLELGYRPILFATFTNALANYSQQLLEQLLEQPIEQTQVGVSTADSLAYHYYKQAFGRPKLADDADALECLKSILDCITLPAHNAFDRRVREDSLARLGPTHLLEEIEDAIESRGIRSRTEYLALERRGRGQPLKVKTREAIWAVYEQWRDGMDRRRQVRWSQLRRRVCELTTQLEPKPYQAIVVDEAQDLSPAALRFLLHLVPDFRGVYLTADASQSIYQRGFSWKQVHADLNVTGRTLHLKRNYRSTKQIVRACNAILAGTDAGDSLNLQPSPHQGESPTLLLSDDRDREAQAVRDSLLHAAKRYRLPLRGGAVLCPSHQMAKDRAERLTRLGLTAQYISSKQLDLDAPHVKVLTLHAAKGLEFPFVAVVGLNEGQLPRVNTELPSQERSAIVDEQRRLLFVGCSRAMRALIACGSRSQPSEFVTSLAEPDWQQKIL